MTSRDFAYWLQGFFEIGGEDAATLVPEQVQMIKQHLNMVFAHEIDPSHGGPEEQAKLNALHASIAPAPNSMEGIQAYNQQAKSEGRPLMRC